MCGWIFGGFLGDFSELGDFSIFEKSPKMLVLQLGFDRLAVFSRKNLLDVLGIDARSPGSRNPLVAIFTHSLGINQTMHTSPTKNPPKIPKKSTKWWNFRKMTCGMDSNDTDPSGHQIALTGTVGVLFRSLPHSDPPKSRNPSLVGQL